MRTHSTSLGTVVKHERIAAVLRARIKRGDFKDRIPSRGALARSFRVNFKTVDKALAALRRERLVVPRNGVGVLVHPRLAGQAVAECYFVFPGHKALTDEQNPTRNLALRVLEDLLTATHQLHAELKILSISPLNNREINWTLLTHLRRDDYVVFLGNQYSDVIQKLAKRGCRCLVLSASPSYLGFSTDGLPIMSFDVDYPDMLKRLVEHLARCGCRHPAVAVFHRWETHSVWPAMLRQLSRECKRQGMPLFRPQSMAISGGGSDPAAFLRQALRQTPPVDAVFTTTERESRQVRQALARCPPAVGRSVRLICFDVHVTWRRGDSNDDVLSKPLGEMARHLMEVVCGPRSFKPGHVTFAARLETAEERELGPADGDRDKAAGVSASAGETVEEGCNPKKRGKHEHDTQY
ncbi:MAG: GntR family transcriptional regulator [Kiritimatiellae bacterium]|nr:GntR family transcriptional regulator [Kiritimatiellia bacterium]